MTFKDADHYMSLCIRTRDGWKCQRCNNEFVVGSSDLHHHHIIGCGNFSVRYDQRNGISLCRDCHAIAQMNARSFLDEMRVRLGEEWQELLNASGNLLWGRIVKRCIKDITKHYREQYRYMVKYDTTSFDDWSEYEV